MPESAGPTPEGSDPRQDPRPSSDRSGGPAPRSFRLPRRAPGRAPTRRRPPFPAPPLPAARQPAGAEVSPPAAQRCGAGLQAPPGPTCTAGEGSTRSPAWGLSLAERQGRHAKAARAPFYQPAGESGPSTGLAGNSARDLALPPPPSSPLRRHQARRRRKGSRIARTLQASKGERRCNRSRRHSRVPKNSAAPPLGPAPCPRPK